VRSLSVEVKLAAAVLAASLVAAAVGAELASGIFEVNVEGAARSTLRSAADAFEAQERAEVEKLAATLGALLANDELRDAFVKRDRRRLLAAAAPLFEDMREHDRISHWYFIEPDPARTVFLRVHRPELHGDRVERVTLEQAADARALGAGKELGQTAFALRAVRPWFHDGRLVGYVELAEEIDHFLAAMKSRTGDEYGLLVKKRYLDEAAWTSVLGRRSNTWNDRPDVVVVDTTTFTEGIIDFDGDLEAVSDRGEALGRIERGDRVWVRGIFPVRDAAGRKVGGLFVLRDFTGQHAAMRAARIQAYLVLVTIACAAAALVAFAVRWLLFARLERLRSALEERAGISGLPPGRFVAVEGDDEIARLEALFQRVLFPSRTRADRAPAAPPRAARDGAAPERAPEMATAAERR
jgi:hypothetical protein